MKRAASVAFGIVGCLLPLRPLFFGPADAVAETIDLIFSPVFIVGRVLPDIYGVWSVVLMVAAMMTNGLLYFALARFAWNAALRFRTRKG